MNTILICDDEPDIVRALRIYLSGENLEIVEAQNGRQAVEIARQREISLILMDIMMPVMDGISAMLEIRKFSNLPIILLTAKAEDTDKILGLNVGADDYITKPFNPAEVQARVRSQLRRYLHLGAGQTSGQALTIGGIELDNDSKTVLLDGEKVMLTPIEFEILRFLMQNPGKVFSPAEIYRKVWNEPYGSEGTVAVHIRHIREKIELNPAEPRYIKVVWGRGYMFDSTAKSH